MLASGTVPETIMETVEDCTPTNVRNNCSLDNGKLDLVRNYSASLSVL